ISFQQLGLLRTTDGGMTFDFAGAGIDTTGASFFTEFAKCPSNDDVFITGSDNLWRTTNFFSGATPFWAVNSPEMVVSITAVAFAPSDATCATYAFGTDDGRLQRTTDAGVTWSDLDAGGAIPGAGITDLSFDPSNGNVLYVTLSGFGVQHVFKAIHALEAFPTWSDVTPAGAAIPFDSIAVSGSDSRIVYAGTDMGLWKSLDGGSSWVHIGPGSGLPYVPVMAVRIND